MKDIELLKKVKELTNKKISLQELCETLNLSEYEVLGLVNSLGNEGTNISVKKNDDGIYLYNRGEKFVTEENIYKLNTEENEFKFVAISDTRLGSKKQQLQILNDIYLKAEQMGYKNVIHCGNITEGLYPITNIYAETMFLDDTLAQIDYITENYPKIEGIKTYFITGIKDDKHLKVNKINIGKRISEARNDMIFLGEGACNLKIDKVNMLIFNQKLEKTYTVSYRPQQQIDSFRSEDKPEILLYGGLLQMQKFTYRNVSCISVPSICATTKEMNDKRYSNTVGAWYVTIKTNSKGKLKKITAIDSVYDDTLKNDFFSKKKIKEKKNG